METVGFIGLGNMGGPVAGHIQRAGFPMIVFDLREEATRPFEERGAKVADSRLRLGAPERRDYHGAADAQRCRASRLRRGRNRRRNQTRRPIYIDISTSPPSLIRKLEPLFRGKGRASFSMRRSLRANPAPHAAFMK